ncbi:MAG: hypothetical protein E6G97_18035 [Alphaproteobacteria bacterium]|nr:MAG: hypothetical protein E6G97_18035 [Alphaproteobacteria bacterium]
MDSSAWEDCSDSGAMLDALLSAHDPSERKLRLFALASAYWRAPGFFPYEQAEQLAEGRLSYKVAVLRAQEWQDGRDHTVVWRESYIFRVRAKDAASEAIRYWRRIYGTDGPLADLLRDVFGDPCRKDHVHLPYHRRVELVTPTVLSLAQAAYESRLLAPCPVCKGTGGSEYRDCDRCKASGQVDKHHLDPVRLQVLADALEDAGCENAIILEHMRGAPCPFCKDALFDVGDSGNAFGFPQLRAHVAKQCACRGTRKAPLLPHARGCWALDLVLGRS